MFVLVIVKSGAGIFVGSTDRLLDEEGGERGKNTEHDDI